MDAINLIIFAVLFVLQVAIIILLLRRRSGDAGHQTELLARQLQAQDNERRAQIERLEAAVQTLREDNYRQQVKLLELVQNQSDSQTRRLGAFMAEMQKSNEQKLDQMRQTVDEKLTGTLNTRLNASFQTVSQQLESVYKSLGEMQKLSSGVTESVNGLNRVLTNVKSRGTWAEVQLGNILDQTVPGMYDTNVATNPKYNGRVEFAVRIPAADGSGHAWLPIDSKFPMEDYARLTAAAQAGDRQGMESAQKALEQRVRDEAKLVRQYISAPETTPFAVLYLATEGLYAQILGSRSGLAEKLQQQGILLAGPTTVTALLNALAMGFRTLAINRKATEVWQVLGAAKMQYEKFGDLLPGLKWLNFGGGHHITRPGYDLATLEACIARMQEKYGVQVYLEPGEAWALNAGYLVTTVLDTLQNGETHLAILDMSAACHTPDVIEMPYRPPLLDAGEPGEKPCTLRLGGPTCLAGDVVGDYSFAAPLTEGDRLIFGDMAIYSTCKNNTFNGMPLPDIWVLHENGTTQPLARFGYHDFKYRLGSPR